MMKTRDRDKELYSLYSY